MYEEDVITIMKFFIVILLAQGLTIIVLTIMVVIMVRIVFRPV